MKPDDSERRSRETRPCTAAPPAWLLEKLQKGEHLLWWGRPRATWWFPAWPATTFIGLVFLGGTIGLPLALREALAFEAGQIAVALFGLVVLLAPLWNLLGLRTVVYAVTDLRAIRGSRLFLRSDWGSSTDNRFLKPWLSTDAQGRKNVLFTKVLLGTADTGSRHVRYRPDGFHHLAPSDADAALEALKACYARTEDLRGLNRRTEGPRSGGWQTEEYVEFPRDRVPNGAKSTFGI